MSRLKENIKIIIFGTNTKAGKLFDEILIITITLSIITVLLDSVESYHEQYGNIFYLAEWIFTILFTIEYFLRIYSVRLPSSYIFSFFGIIDLLSIIPTYISILFPGAQALSVIRVLRVLRIFRVLKLFQYIGEAKYLKTALISSKRKIYIFIFVVMNIVIILGSIMYLIEGGKNGFTSIPRSIYWAIVTITTVGYGDISPKTELGQILASFAMILGYATIAVPTGIISAEYSNMSNNISNKVCSGCGNEQHSFDAEFCNRCGTKLDS